MHAKNLPKKLWAEVLNIAVFVLNTSRTVMSKKDGKSSFEVWTNKTFDISTLKVFGDLVYAHIPKKNKKKVREKT